MNAIQTREMLTSSTLRIGATCLVTTLTVLAISCAQPSPPQATDQNAEPITASDVVHSAGVLEPSRTRSSGHILHIDTFSCGYPDPAVDFARSLHLHGLSVTPEIHAGLTRLAKSDLGETVVAPELADSYQASDGATKFDFQLRPDLRFSDGRPLLASHVKWSWERALRKSTPPSRARTVLGSIIGADAIISGQESELLGVEVVDDRQLIVNLSEPQPDFPAAISDPVAAVLHPDNVAGWDDVWVNDPTLPARVIEITDLPLITIPTGAGPFKLVEYVKPEHAETSAGTRRRCVLERNPHYWDPSAPALDGIVATIYPDIWLTPQDTANRQRLELESGTLDIAGTSAAPEGESLTSDIGSLNRINARRNPRVRALVFNPSIEPFNEIEVRRAFVDVVPAAIMDGETRATRIVPDSIAHSDWNPIQAADNNAPLDQIAERAIPITLYFHTLALVDGVHEAVVDAWEDALNAQVSWEEFEFPDGMPQPPLHQLQVAEVHNYAAISTYDALKAILEAFGTDNMPPQFAELKAQLDNARHNLDAVSRNAEYQRIEQTLLDEAYVLPIYANSWDYEALVQPWVHGLEFPLPGGSYYKDVWFDETAPERTLPIK